MSVSDFAALVARVERARIAHNAIPWWKILRRQEAARTYCYALLAAALYELKHPNVAALRPGEGSES